MSWAGREFWADAPQALRSSIVSAAFAVLLAANACAGAADSGTRPAESPLTVYGRLPTLEDFALSPDGTRVAYVHIIGDERYLVVRQLGVSQALGGVHVGDAKQRDIKWMDNDNLLITVSSTSPPPIGFIGPKHEWFQLLTYKVSSHKLAGMNFAVLGEITFNVIAGTPMLREVNGVTTLFVPGIFLADRTLPALFKYDVASGSMRLIAKSSQPVTEWLVDESGQIAGEFEYQDEQKSWLLKARRAGHTAVVASGSAALDVPSLLGFNAAGDSIIMQFIENGDPVWRLLSLKDQAWSPPLAKSETFSKAIVDRKSGRIIGGAQGTDSDSYFFFDNEMQAHWDALLRAFPQERVRLMTASDDFSKILVRVFGVKDGYAYALFDWYTHQFGIVGEVREGLTNLAEVRRIGYPAADGLAIPGYLTLPHGREAANLPLIVLPHGGPAAADTQDFDWLAQALAAQGYAVLQPNYRGSALSYRFISAGFGEWGRKMQTDLSDGVRYLAQQGVIDPKRVCIVGGSYGGYAALAGITLDPGIYRCAVSVAGISDLARFLHWTNETAGRRDNLAQRYWDRFLDVSGPGDPKIKVISPIEHLDAVSVPVLLIHGRDDTVVPYEQSEVMAQALKHAGKAVELETLKREDHWLSRSATRLQMLEATVAFLKTNNPP